MSKDRDKKRFYWIKLETSFFNLDAIDFLLGQPNGSKYIVLYQMLMLKTANTGGALGTIINGLLIPFDIQKIARDSKHFDEDTVKVALDWYTKLGLIVQSNKDGTLLIREHENIVGSKSYGAVRKAEQRTQKKQIEQLGQSGDNVPQEYRVKSIELIDKDIKEIDSEKDTKKVAPTSKYHKETTATSKIVIKHLNEALDKELKYNADTHMTVISARLNDGYKLEDFIKVIDIKVSQWKDDDKMKSFLRTSTLFSSKHFDNYLNEDMKTGGTVTQNYSGGSRI